MAARLSSLARSSAVMTAGTLTSRLLGFAKAILLATAIGVTVGGTADAFDVANKVPNNLYMLLAGGILNAVLVPQIIRAAKRPDGGQDFVNRLLTLAIMVLAGVSVLATLAAPLLVRLYSSTEWSDDKQALAIAFAYWCLPQVFFYGLYTMLGQVLNAHSNFGPYMWAPVLNNVIAIAGLGVFIFLFGTGRAGEHAVGTWDATKITVLAGSATLGVVCQAFILLWPLKRIGFSFRPTFGFRGVGLGTAGNIATWTFGAVLVGQLGFIVTSRVAASASSSSGEVSASLAAYTLSYLVFMLPHSLVAVSLATALFTSLSTYAAEKDTASVRAALGLGLRLVGLVNVFATATLITLSTPAAMVISGGSVAEGSGIGALDQARAIGPVIATMVAGLIPFSANYLLQRVYYAYEDAKTPFWVQVPQIVLTAIGVVASGLLLPGQWILAGIGVSMSIGYVFAALVSATLLRRKLKRLGAKDLIVSHLKFGIAALIASAVGAAGMRYLDEDLYSSWTGSFLVCAVGASVMLAVYLGVCYLLRVRELHQTIQTVRTKLAT
ncbi:murein biosynthesis integral membrane protein MurJ [Brevibacterium jeotgali]|uniref:Putative peptidoglycan lipid II flippase n=1 Tax=Brevibacterium jeotgali TaxID=1262550 RepID=A0A2H1L5B3_9MICO|nr:murein biosynthesis integral membrane protein MurJ [Brevibacterium jeotgali]TWC01454.1 putative peptidoglycan lipid II flippase [Brevibacterium jeotgali]SMY11940.1 putative peptidoglycan lipid II flippase [Brevibacterium jeotgali]